MQKQPSFPSADAYVASLDGWRRACVERLRASVLAEGRLQEAVKWGHLVYAANGPVLLIRAEPERVLFGFWRGQRLREIEPALMASGQYEMATLQILEGMPVDAATARRLAQVAVTLNETLGDPRLAAKRRKVSAGGAKRAKVSPASRTARKKKTPTRNTGHAKKASRGAKRVRKTTTRGATSRRKTAPRSRGKVTSRGSRKGGRRDG